MDLLNSFHDSKNSFIKIEGTLGTSKWLFTERVWNSFSYETSLLVIVEKDKIESTYSDLEFFLKKISGTNNDFLVTYPPWEVLPFESLSPHPDLSGDRLRVLDHLRKKNPVIVITSIEALMQNVMPQETLKQNTLKLETGDYLERELITDYLVNAGYQSSDLVEYKGEFSIRGGILDVFVTSQSNPIRVEFFGDEIESIKEFDKNTQRSTKVIDSFSILPSRELIINKDQLKDGIEKIKIYSNKNEEDDFTDIETVIECFKESIVFSGMEKFTPFFYEQTTLFDYLPKNSSIIIDEEDTIKKAHHDFNSIVLKEYKNSLQRREFCPRPDMIYLDYPDFLKQAKKFQTFSLSSLKISADESATIPFLIHSANIFNHLFNKFIDKVKEWLKDHQNIFLVMHTDGQANRVKEILLENEIGTRILSKSETINPNILETKPKSSDNVVSLIIGNLSSGFIIPSSKIIFITEEEIYGPQKKIRLRKGAKKENLLAEIDHIKPGEFVVHIDYGIGVYLGTKFITVHNREEEFLEIEYNDGEKLYLPMEGIALLQKYRGVEDSEPTLAKLGSSSWKKTKQKVKEDVRKIAEELLKLYAEREIAAGIGHSADTTWHKEFYESFEYNETEDQMRTISDVLADMENEKPMDRLVCGDVGFGKTEVAMRAAFKAVYDKKQVAVLVPTTILAHQHYQTFLQRFKLFPVQIEMLSRFKSKKEQSETIARLRDGKVDIVIGTHRLIQKDIDFLDLGLLIIDEEHRFGVAHKEKLKKMRNYVDILTLTATPIPRTLNIALSGIRNMSIITTPPHDRQAIKTYIRKFDDHVIHDAILRELERDGQIYFVHNRVQSIYQMEDYLKKLVPQAKIKVAHGQMQEKELEKAMMSFINKEVDILLCTTIIESGLDIPTANTIIINRADKLGLAQLYQLRGRVGRDRHRAYAYLLVPGEFIVSKIAKSRLEALEGLTDLGAGLQLATRDLEIRGTGNILGHKQSGNVSNVGFYMYCKLLEENIKELKGGKIEKEVETVVNIGIKGFIPKDFIPNVNQRLEIYKRLYIVKDQEQLSNISDEITDRFGPLPKEVFKFIKILSMRINAQNIKVLRIEKSKEGVTFTFDQNAPLDVLKVLTFIKKRKDLKFLSPEAIHLSLKEGESDQIINKINTTLSEFQKMKTDL